MTRFLFAAFSFLFVGSTFFSAAQQPDSLYRKARLTGYASLRFSLTNLFGNEIGMRYNHEVALSGNGLVHSSSITLPFTKSILRNEFIDDELKQQCADLLGNNNAFELTYDVGISGSWLQDSFIFHKPTLYSVDYSFGDFTGACFTDDVFNTIFYGNAYYAGQTADYGGTKIYQYSYDRIGFSAQQKIELKNSYWEVGGKISLLGVHSALNLTMDKATLFTAETGEFIDAEYNFEFSESDSTNHHALQVDGFGTAADVVISRSNREQSSNWTLTLNDLGIAFWNSRTRTYYADSSIHFVGIEVSNLFSQDSDIIHYNRDSLFKNTGTKEKLGAKTFLLPAHFSLTYTRSLSQKWLLSAGISYRPYTDFYPLIFAAPQFVISPSFRLSLPVSAGGSERYAVGLSGLVNAGTHMKLFFGSDNFLGLFVPKQTTSSSLFLRLAYQF